MIRRLQGATRQQWEAWDRAAARAGYATTSRWIRDVCVREAASDLRYRLEVQGRGGVWRSYRGRPLSADQCALVIAALRTVRVTARAVEVTP